MNKISGFVFLGTTFILNRLLKQTKLLQIIKGCLPQTWSILEYFVPYYILKGEL